MTLKTYRSQIDGAALAAEFDKLKPTVDGTGILMHNGQFRLMPGGWPECAGLACLELERHTGLTTVGIMVNTILPGGRSGVHVDPEAGKLSRWHLPLRTNLKAWFWSEATDNIHMFPWRWYGPILYWEPHAVGNDGDEPRTHLVVDLH